MKFLTVAAVLLLPVGAYAIPYTEITSQHWDVHQLQAEKNPEHVVVAPPRNSWTGTSWEQPESYSVLQFNLTPSDFGSTALEDISSLTLKLFVDSNAIRYTYGRFSVFYISNSTFATKDMRYSPVYWGGISVSEPQVVPGPYIMVGNGYYDHFTDDLLPLDIASVKDDILEKINAGTPLRFIVTTSYVNVDHITSRWFGLGSDHPEKAPSLTIDATTVPDGGCSAVLLLVGLAGVVAVGMLRPPPARA